MKPQAFQHGEIRDENDNIIKAGAYGKNTAFANKTNDGILDYIINNFEWLYDNVTNFSDSISEVLKQNKITNEYKSIWSLCTKNENIAIASIQALNFCINIAIWIGENKTHNAGDLLFTIPGEYAPRNEQRVPFTGQASKVSGIVKIATDGKVTVFSISNTTIADRIAFNCMYFI